jgi:hypothetical protein
VDWRTRLSGLVVPGSAGGGLVVAGSRGNVLHVGSGQTYATVQAAVAAASPGDTVYVHAGSYARQTITAVKSDYVTVMPNPGDTPSIAGFWVDAGAYIDFSGFTTTDGNRVQNGAHHVKWRFFQASAPNITTPCFYVSNGNCHDVYVEDNVCSGTHQCGFQSTGAAAAVSLWSYNVYVRRNTISGSNQDGMFIDGLNEIYIEDNEIFDITRNTLHNDGIQVTSCNGCYIRRNHIHDTRAFPANEFGSGIITEHANGNTDPLRLVQNIEVVSNLIHRWHGGGLTIDGTINSYFANNTVYNNFGQGTGDGYDVGIVPTDSTFTNDGDFEMWNNIFGAIWRGTGGFPTFNSNNHITGSNGIGGTNLTTGDPLFVSTGSSGTYALQSGSACKDSGTTRARTPSTDVHGTSFGTQDRGAVAA